jgi:peptide deformylase
MKISTIVDSEHLLRNETELVSEDEMKSIEFEDLINTMIELCKEYNGLGLAANQVFVNKRMFVYLKENDVFDVIINPEIIVKKDFITHHSEGCLSMPEHFYDVKRAKTMIIECLDREGRKMTLKAPSKRIAFIWQHEIDHLNGMLISDKGKRK